MKIARSDLTLTILKGGVLPAYLMQMCTGAWKQRGYVVKVKLGNTLSMPTSECLVLLVTLLRHVCHADMVLSSMFGRFCLITRVCMYVGRCMQ